MFIIIEDKIKLDAAIFGANIPYDIFLNVYKIKIEFLLYKNKSILI